MALATPALAPPVPCAGPPSLCHHTLRIRHPALWRTRASRMEVPRSGHRSVVLKAAQLERAAATIIDEADDLEEEEFEEDDTDDTGLSTKQVQTVLQVLCEETEVAELELKMGSFEMRVRRSSKGTGSGGMLLNGAYTNGATPIPTPPPGTAFASTASMDIPAFEAAQAPSEAVASVDEDIDDESTIFLTAPKVGIMRRGRYVKGKKVGKGNVINVGDEVKKGQPLGFIEQLGTYVPVEAPQAGEIVAFVVEEGAAVEYAQPIIELVPFFGGHIIGDRKHA